MNIELLFTDLKGLKAKDFNYKYAYNDRKNGKPAIRLAGEPLEEVLKTHKVCISGYLMSKLNFNNTTPLQKRYNVTREQFDAIIQAKATIRFNDGSEVETPKNKASLKQVLNHIKNITSNENWLKDDIDYVRSENNY